MRKCLFTPSFFTTDEKCKQLPISQMCRFAFLTAHQHFTAAISVYMEILEDLTDLSNFMHVLINDVISKPQ